MLLHHRQRIAWLGLGLASNPTHAAFRLFSDDVQVDAGETSPTTETVTCPKGG